MVFNLSIMFLVYILPGNFLSISTAEPLEGENVIKLKEHIYPFVVSIALKNNKIYEEQLNFCTGVLIAKTLVLTVAHCLKEKSPSEIQVIIGSVDLRQGKKYDILTWITYNQWADIHDVIQKKSINDIAIIKLSNKVRKIVAKPAVLSFEKNDNLIDKYVVLTGWGRKNKNLVKTRYLQEVKVKVLPNTMCEKMTEDLIKIDMSIDDRYLCTKGNPHAFLTMGDSGGPVIKNNKVVGINKAACLIDGVCDVPIDVFNEHQYNIHMSIDFYRDFIIYVLNNYDN